ncbi:MFS transporter [Streptomyces sp. AC627_RSS907]|uniref:MFS transporter n=1 Tax=Streptomyces sp. AC627_RSS907 TaxID=2823684 RepID=UPI001C25DA58|nr:MFS transporter [Streptomyces sp. AC627_RSS907]
MRTKTGALPDTTASPGRNALAAAIVMLAVFVVPTSISGTAVALPDIGADTGAGLISLQWVVNGFNVAFACFTLAWGSLSDIIGRVRAFGIGAAIYALASLASALAPNALFLDIARVAAGLGGAALFSCGSALLAMAFTGPARDRVFAMFGAVSGIGIALGPSLSGLMADHLGWRWIFAAHAIAVTAGLLALPFATRHLTFVRREDTRFDIPGTALFVTGVLLLTVGIVQASQWGWGDMRTLGLFAAAAVALAVFASVQRRREHPMLDLSLVTDRRVLALSLVPVAASFGFITIMTYLPNYLSTVRGASTSAAGLTMVLLTLPVLLCPLIAGKLVARGVPATTLLLVSAALLVVGDLSLLLFGEHVSVAVVALPMLVTGAGMGLSAGLVDGQLQHSVPPHKAGMAAGFLNTMRLGSEAIAVAIFGSLLATFIAIRTEDGARAADAVPADVADDLAAGDLSAATEHAAAAERADFSSFLRQAYDSAFHSMLWLMAGIGLLLLVVIWALLRSQRPARRATAPEDSTPRDTTPAGV